MDALAKTEAAERRSEPRQRMNAVVKLDPSNGGDLIACFVWDMSESGARLKLSVDSELSQVVQVLIGNVRKPATVVWRKGDQVGLEFLPE
jgi:hypothetical protein